MTRGIHNLVPPPLADGEISIACRMTLQPGDTFARDPNSGLYRLARASDEVGYIVPMGSRMVGPNLVMPYMPPPVRRVFPSSEALKAADTLLNEQTARLVLWINDQTHAWLKKAIERGPTWGVVRRWVRPRYEGLGIDRPTFENSITLEFSLIEQLPDGRWPVWNDPDVVVLIPDAARANERCPHAAGGCEHTRASFALNSTCRFGGCPWGGDI